MSLLTAVAIAVGVWAGIVVLLLLGYEWGQRRHGAKVRKAREAGIRRGAPREMVVGQVELSDDES